MKITKIQAYCLVGLGMLTWLGCSESNNNQIPTIHSLIAVPDTVHLDGSSTITVDAEDPDNDSLTFHWEANAGTLIGSGPAVLWQSPDTEGTYSILCTVSDNRGGGDSRMVNIVALSTVLIDYDSANEFMEVPTSSDTWCAQHFELPRGANIDSFAVKVHAVSGSPGNLVVELWNDELGHPLELLAAAEEVAPTVGWNTVALRASHFVHGGVVFYLVVRPSEGGAGDTISLAADARGSYPGGYLLIRPNPTAEWSDDMNADLEFRVIGHYQHALPPEDVKADR